MNIDFRQGKISDFEYVRGICEQHPECKGCPLVSGQPLVINGKTTQCITGMNKKED